MFREPVASILICQGVVRNTQSTPMDEDENEDRKQPDSLEQ